MKKLIILGLGFTLATVLANAAAVGLGINSSVLPGSVTSLPTSAPILTESGTYAFPAVPAQDIAGTYKEWAYADAANPLGAGDTTIVLQLTDTSGPATIERATLANFTAASQTSVAYLATSTVAPTSSTKDTLGDVIAFNFTGLTPGDVETLIVYTNIVNATPGLVSIEDGSAGYGVGISPGAAPEPMSMSLLGGGLALLGALRFGRKRK
jgi:hypothetical protein